MDIINQQSILAKIFHDVYKEYYNDTLKWYPDKLITNYT